MYTKFPRRRKVITTLVSLMLLLISSICFGFLYENVFSENAKFQKFTHELYNRELSGNLLSLHYTLAFPEKMGITRPPATLGTVETDFEKTELMLSSLEHTLKKFAAEKLSLENRITRDSLLLYLQNQHMLSECFFLEEYLSPSLGIQAQLPILLAEYSFYQSQDISDYLNLLSSVRPYFESIINFEQIKSEKGFFMNDTSLNRIIEQCQSFIKNPDSNYMLEIFSQKLKDYGTFSKKERQQLEAVHKKILLKQVIPAYQYLISELCKLKGTAQNNLGLFWFKNGKTYYEYLLRSQVGTLKPVENIEHRLSAQLKNDCAEIKKILDDNPSFLTILSDSSHFPKKSPSEMLTFLQKKIQTDFPPVITPNWEIRSVHPSMAAFLSPAFYLSPPLDTPTTNIIYLNPLHQTNGLELFTTLAHEAFPGHLYQTVYHIKKSSSSPIRSLISPEGYIEGWATYAESYAFTYAADFFKENINPDLMRLAWLNRSVNLCLYSIIDIGIHYKGWNQKQTELFLKIFGITDIDTTNEIFQYILETPANYLKYYWGYISFLDLKTDEEQCLGTNFSLSDFHKKLLEIGPSPFPILKKYLEELTSAPKAPIKNLPFVLLF